MTTSLKDGAAAAANAVVKSSIEAALRQVIDPEIGLDVVALGLIYDIAVADHDVVVTYTLTTPGCPLAEYMRAAIQHAASGAADGRSVEPRLVYEPRWTPERIEETSW